MQGRRVEENEVDRHARESFLRSGRQRRRVPQTYRLVTAARGDARAVRTEGHARDPVAVTVQRQDVLAGTRVAELDRVVPTSDGQTPAATIVSRLADAIAATGNLQHDRAGLGVPDLRLTL